MGKRTLTLRIIAKPEPALLLPENMVPTAGTRKTHPRVAVDHPRALKIIVPHTPAMVQAVHKLEEASAKPYSEYGTVMIVECMGQRQVMNWDDLGESKDVKFEWQDVGRVPAGTQIIFRQQFHSFTREGKKVGQFGGAATLELTHALKGSRQNLVPVDYTDNPSTEEAPDFLASWGSGYPKGKMRVEVPSPDFTFTVDDFDGNPITKEEIERQEMMMDEVIYTGVAGVFDIRSSYPRAKQRKELTYQGTAPMQAPAYRVAVPPGKLPGGAWAMLRTRRPISAALWHRLLAYSLDRHSHMAVSVDTPLHDAAPHMQQRWFLETVHKQFTEWGPAHQRVHPEFFVAVSVVFGAITMIDTSIWYFDDHTNENSPSITLDEHRIKPGNNQGLSMEDLSGDCDTMSGSIVRMWEDLITTMPPTGTDPTVLRIIEAARDVARLYEVGMPHSSVSAASVQREDSAEPQNHMYALGIPRETFYAMLQAGDNYGKVYDKYPIQMKQAKNRFASNDKYTGRAWHWYLQNVVLEGTGPLMSFPFPAWMSAVPTLYAHDASKIPQEELDASLKRAEHIAFLEQAALEMEGVLAQNAGFAFTSMMLYDNPLYTIEEFAKGGLDASHFYKVAMGFQLSGLERAGVPVIDLEFIQGIGGFGTVGVSYAHLMMAPLRWAAKYRGEKIPDGALVCLEPSVVLTPEEMRIVRDAVEQVPAPDCPALVELSYEQQQYLRENIAVKKRSVGGDIAEVTYFVRMCDMPVFVERLKAQQEHFAVVEYRPRPLIKSTTMDDMDVIVIDVLVGIGVTAPKTPVLDVQSAEAHRTRVHAQLASARK